MAYIRSQVDDDPRLGPLVAEFVEQLAVTHTELHRAVAEGDVVTLRLHAHRLRGCAASYGYPELGDLATAAEDAMDGNDWKPAIAAMIGHIVLILASPRARASPPPSPPLSPPPDPRT